MKPIPNNWPKIKTGARAEVIRPFRSLEDDNDMDVKRQRLGEPLATLPAEVVGEETSDIMTDEAAPLVHEERGRERFTRKTSREPEELSCGIGEPKRMRTGCLRVRCVNAPQKSSTRTEGSFVECREVHIKHLLDTGAVKDWNNEDAIKTGAKILSRKFVDDAHKEKSRWCAKEFATNKYPSVFAAASDLDNTSLIDLLAVKRGHSIMC